MQTQIDATKTKFNAIIILSFPYCTNAPALNAPTIVPRFVEVVMPMFHRFDSCSLHPSKTVKVDTKLPQEASANPNCIIPTHIIILCKKTYHTLILSFRAGYFSSYSTTLVGVSPLVYKGNDYSEIVEALWVVFKGL